MVKVGVTRFAQMVVRVKAKAKGAVNVRRRGSVAVISTCRPRALTTMGRRADHERRVRCWLFDGRLIGLRTFQSRTMTNITTCEAASATSAAPATG